MEWSPPTKTDVEGKSIPKSKVEWTNEADTLASKNSRALNAIFNGVDPAQFKMISIIEVAKQAWDILRVSFEGMGTVCESRLELLTAKFKNLRMLEKETIRDFNGQLYELENASFDQGVKILRNA